MRYFIYWKNQTTGAPLATIDAPSPEMALKQFTRESPYPIRADQMAVTTVLR